VRHHLAPYVGLLVDVHRLHRRGLPEAERAHGIRHLGGAAVAAEDRVEVVHGCWGGGGGGVGWGGRWDCVLC